MRRLAAFLLGIWCAGFGTGPAAASSGLPPSSDIPARIDLYDETGRIYLVVYYAQMRHDPSGEVRFVRPRAVVLPREGGSLDELIARPVAEIVGATGAYDPARKTLRVDEARSTFHMAAEAAADPAGAKVTVDSRRLDVFPQESRAVYEDQVTLTRRETVLRCDRLEARWDPETKKLRTARATGAPAVGTRRSGERLEADVLQMDLLLGRGEIPPGTGGRATFLAPSVFKEGRAR